MLVESSANNVRSKAACRLGDRVNVDPPKLTSKPENLLSLLLTAAANMLSRVLSLIIRMLSRLGSIALDLTAFFGSTFFALFGSDDFSAAAALPRARLSAEGCLTMTISSSSSSSPEKLPTEHRTAWIEPSAYPERPPTLA